MMKRNLEVFILGFCHAVLVCAEEIFSAIDPRNPDVEKTIKFGI